MVARVQSLIGYAHVPRRLWVLTRLSGSEAAEEVAGDAYGRAAEADDVDALVAGDVREGAGVLSRPSAPGLARGRSGRAGRGPNAP